MELTSLRRVEKGLEASRKKFDNTLTAVRMLATKVPQYVIPFWYGKEAMFWLPYGWFPYYAEWIISFPRAPLGSVSAPSWQLACSGFIKLASELIDFIWTTFFSGAKTEETTTEKQPQKIGTKMAVPQAMSEKREL